MQKALAEKEKEVKELICDYESRITKEQELMPWLEHKVEENDQAKTDFAIEQLELALDIVENGLDDALKNSSLNSIYYDKILDKLDQQINKLKEM